MRFFTARISNPPVAKSKTGVGYQNLMPVVFLRIFETKFCAGTHSGGQVRYDSDTERIYAALSTFSGTRTGIPCVTRVSCDIGCRQDGKRKSPHLRAFTMQMVGTCQPNKSHKCLLFARFKSAHCTITKTAILLDFLGVSRF